MVLKPRLISKALDYVPLLYSIFFSISAKSKFSKVIALKVDYLKSEKRFIHEASLVTREYYAHYVRVLLTDHS